jgi:hypothetical protein
VIRISAAGANDIAVETACFLHGCEDAGDDSHVCKMQLRLKANHSYFPSIQQSAEGTAIADFRFHGGNSMKPFKTLFLALFFAGGLIGCSSPMTTRESGAVVGAVSGAAVGGVVGSAVGHPGAGAAIGGVAGLGAGALIGDRLQAIEQRQSELDKQIKDNEAELKRQREELEKLRQESSGR